MRAPEFRGFSQNSPRYTARSTAYRSVLTACAGDGAVEWARDRPEGSTVGVGVSSARRASAAAFNSPILLVRPRRRCVLPTTLRGQVASVDAQLHSQLHSLGSLPLTREW